MEFKCKHKSGEENGGEMRDVIFFLRRKDAQFNFLVYFQDRSPTSMLDFRWSSSNTNSAPCFGISVSSNLYCCSSLIKSIVHSKRVTRTLSFYSTCISFVFSRFFHNLIIIAITLWGQLTCINQLGLSHPSLDSLQFYCALGHPNFTWKINKPPLSYLTLLMSVFVTHYPCISSVTMWGCTEHQRIAPWWCSTQECPT